MKIILYPQGSWDLPTPSQHSYLLICPWCGNQWCRVEGSNLTQWFHIYVPCEHDSRAARAYGCDYAGCLLEAYEVIKLEDLSPLLLKREFNLTMGIPNEC